jgi:SAM-dependent methyltransferase
MHSEAHQFAEQVKRRFPQFFDDSRTRVLEVGSLFINGGIRDLFQSARYTGIDVARGPGVDIVVDAAEYDGGPFDVVASTEMFEHNARWRETWVNMVRLVRPAGLVFFTCATTGRGEHGTHSHDPSSSPATLDYYGNRVAEDFDTSAFARFEFSVDKGHKDLFFWGIKHGDVLGGLHQRQ